MTKINQNLYGLWQMISMRYQDDGGTWQAEPVFGGHSLFTSSGHILTFTRAEISFGYSGHFAIDGDDMVITLEVCSLPELEKTQIKRTVLKLSNEALTLGMTDFATGRKYEIDFRLSARSL